MATDKRELKKFGMVMGTVIPLLFGILLPWMFKKTLLAWPWILGAIFWVSALFFPLLLRPVHIVWMRLSTVLGWLNSKVILGAVFFFLITPIGVIMRIFGRNFLKLGYEENVPTYRIRMDEAGNKNIEVPY